MAKTRGKAATLFGHLYFQVILGVLLGVIIGFLNPALGESLEPLADAFIKLVKMVLAPIIFGTIVVGIAKMGNLKEVGRVGVKALVYFEIVSTLALVIGLVVVNVLRPGAGMNIDPHTLDTTPLASYTSAAKSPNAVSFFLDIIPTSIADAFVKGNMLQVLLFSVLFGLALAQLPDRGKLIVDVIDSVLHGLFGIVRFIMRLAPLAAFGAMAFTIGKYGLDTLSSFGKLIGCVYLASLVFIVIVLGGIARMNRVSLWKFLKFIKDEILIVFATASTEAVLPQMMAQAGATGVRQAGCGHGAAGRLHFQCGWDRDLSDDGRDLRRPGHQHAVDTLEPACRPGSFAVHVQGVRGSRRGRIRDPHRHAGFHEQNPRRWHGVAAWSRSFPQ